MNSWHSFSPNGRWLVFSSKARSPYTQMYLTHIDENGNDSPAILIDNSTAANRAVNLPEFVNLPSNGLLKIDTPAIEMYSKFDKAVQDGKAGDTALAISEWEELLKEYPDDARIQNYMGAVLVQTGRTEEAIPYFERGLKINPQYRDIQHNLISALLALGRVREAIEQLEKALAVSPNSSDLHNSLGSLLSRNGQLKEAAAQFKRAIEISPDLADAHLNLGTILLSTGRPVEAAEQLSRAIESDPSLSAAHIYLGVALYYGQGKVGEALTQWRKAIELDPTSAFAFSQAAHALSASPVASDRNGEEAVKLAEQAVELSKGGEPMYLDSLAMAYAEEGEFPLAVETAQGALRLAREQNQTDLADALGSKINLYQAGKPYRDDLRRRQ
jgi:tetratricopeptide (TPR) repeat protein